jgi:DNA-binding LacI/PurR family transcriptional regulator
LRKRKMVHTQQLMMIAEILRQHGLEHHAVTIYYSLVARPGENTSTTRPEEVAHAAKWLRDRKPTGVLGSDFRLAAIARAADLLGLRIGPGRDIEMIGLGNTPWADALGIDSIGYREDVIAQHVVNLITNDLARPDESAHHIVVAPKLVVRAAAVQSQQG